MPKGENLNQFYMRHPQFKKKVTAKYDARYLHSPVGDTAIKERNRITAEMLQKEPDEVREALKKEAVDELKVAKERYEEARRELPSDVPEDIEEYVTSFLSSKNKSNSHSRARASLGCVIQPLINGIRLYTKTSVTILIGSPPSEEGGNYFVKVMNSGTMTDTSTLKDFHDWNEQGFKKNIVQHFLCFLLHTSVPSGLYLICLCLAFAETGLQILLRTALLHQSVFLCWTLIPLLQSVFLRQSLSCLLRPSLQLQQIVMMNLTILMNLPPIFQGHHRHPSILTLLPRQQNLVTFSQALYTGRLTYNLMQLLLRSVTTKGNHLCSHGHKGECPIGEEAYKILYPLGGRPTPSGCTGIDQSKERDPSNITLYGYTSIHKRSG